MNNKKIKNQPLRFSKIRNQNVAASYITRKRIIFALLLILSIAAVYFIFKPKQTDYSGIFVRTGQQEEGAHGYLYKAYTQMCAGGEAYIVYI